MMRAEVKVEDHISAKASPMKSARMSICLSPRNEKGRPMRATLSEKLQMFKIRR
jgi:hypothetical protein